MAECDPSGGWVGLQDRLPERNNGLDAMNGKLGRAGLQGNVRRDEVRGHEHWP